jgi:hypothetical protein
VLLLILNIAQTQRNLVISKYSYCQKLSIRNLENKVCDESESLWTWTGSESATLIVSNRPPGSYSQNWVHLIRRLSPSWLFTVGTFLIPVNLIEFKSDLEFSWGWSKNYYWVCSYHMCENTQSKCNWITLKYYWIKRTLNWQIEILKWYTLLKWYSNMTLDLQTQ